MTSLENVLFAVLLLMVPIWFICIARLSRRLHDLHAAKYEKMGMANMWPRDLAGWLSGYNNTKPVLALMQFLFAREDVALRDPAISRLSAFMRWFLCAYLLVFAALVFSMLNPGLGQPVDRARGPGPVSRHDRLREQAFDLHRAGKWAEAVPVYDELLGKSEEDAELLYWRGMAQWLLHHNDQALEDFRRVMTLEPGNFEAHRNADRILSEQRRWDEVLEIWNLYLTTTPTDAEAYFERGGTNYHKGDLAAARADAARACELGKSEACSWAKRLEKRM